jgi:hypothetical protein
MPEVKKAKENHESMKRRIQKTGAKKPSRQLMSL